VKKFLTLDKPVPGDRVGIVSPSVGLPGLYPWVQDLALKRLRDEFGLVPQEYPTTRQMGSSYEDRARDLMDAFADPGIKAVLASVGGEDEIGLIKHLDPGIFLANPKPFFGYSDNTNIHNFLWELGIPSFYGFSTLANLAIPPGTHPLTVRSLRHALFDSGEVEVEVSTEYTDIDLDWADPANLDRAPVMEPNDGLYWDGDGDVEGTLWGGCCEVFFALMASGHHIPADEDLDGAVFYMETSELVPDPFLVGYLMTGFGERGWLDRFSAILVGRPKAWAFDKQNDTRTKAAYRERQRREILTSVRAYNPTIPVVQNLDFGHTNPQIIVPNGGRARVLGSTKQVFFTY